LKGRSDQRFCNDTCRNTYNRIKRELAKVTPPKAAAEIIKIIKRNYEILKREIPGKVIDKYGTIQCDSDVVAQSGLNRRFYTSSFNGSGGTWYCVFDRCYSIQGDNFYMIDSSDQLDIEH
jgi:hypothetical protein